MEILILVLLLGVYLLLTLGHFFLLRRAGYDRAWFSFVPILNVYKIFSMNYDYFKGMKVVRELEEGEFKHNRRYAAMFLTVSYMILVTASGVIEEMINPTDLTREAVSPTNPIQFIFTGFTDVLTFTIMAFVLFFMFRMFINKNTGEPLNALIIGIFIIGSFLSYGLTIVLLMYYVGLSPKYEYDLNR